MPTFPTLSRNPSYPLDPDGMLEDVIIRSPQAAGYEQTRPRTTRARRSWGVRYNKMPAADAATLRSFEEVTLRNGADSFTWTHPISGTSYTVRLTAPIKYSSREKGGPVEVSFNLREV